MLCLVRVALCTDTFVVSFSSRNQNVYFFHFRQQVNHADEGTSKGTVQRVIWASGHRWDGKAHPGSGKTRPVISVDAARPGFGWVCPVHDDNKDDYSSSHRPVRFQPCGSKNNGWSKEPRQQIPKRDRPLGNNRHGFRKKGWFEHVALSFFGGWMCFWVRGWKQVSLEMIWHEVLKFVWERNVFLGYATRSIQSLCHRQCPCRCLHCCWGQTHSTYGTRMSARPQRWQSAIVVPCAKLALCWKFSNVTLFDSTCKWCCFTKSFGVLCDLFLLRFSDRVDDGDSRGTAGPAAHHREYALSFCPSVCMSVCFSACVFLCLCICPSVCLSVFVCPSVSLPVHSLCLSVSQSD